ncbi:MAG TPA: hypothetical protein VKM55_15905 [Candidatus Lokiarchaeia archaeon]|nr:hypothetical protein [Candidatus Lokiarchaeia archaeon]
MDENTNTDSENRPSEELVEESAKSDDEKSKTDGMSQFDLESRYPNLKGWEMIGFHRQLGGEFWNILLQLASMALAVFMGAYIQPLVSPYPEIGGYSGIAGGLFAIVFTVFDVATNFGVGQFVAENRVTNPEKMMEYVRFFIWWQMMVGIVIITTLSWYTFEIIVYGQYAYLTWLLLVGLSQQWPNMLGIFRSCIDGFQHFDKSNLMNFLSGTVVGQLLNIAIVLVGRWYGDVHPEVGEIIGMAIAGSIGGYINGIMFFFVSIHFFNQITKPMGYSARDAFSFKFGRDVVKRCLIYGVQSSIVPVFASATSLLFLVWKTTMIPSYASWNALIGFAGSVAGNVNQFGTFDVRTALSEAYPNGKKNLAEFYVAYSMKWRMLFFSMMSVTFITIYPFFKLIYYNVSGLQYWIPALAFYYPQLVRQIWNPITGVPDMIMLGTFRIKQFTIARIIEISMDVVNLYLLLFVFDVQNTMNGITFLIAFDMIIPLTIKTVYCWIYCNRKIVKIKIYWMSSIILPAIAASPMFLFSWVWLNYVFYPLWSILGIILTATISILFAFIFMFFLMYFPILAIIGGFDDYMFYIFHKSVEISGPSKPMMKNMEKLVARAIKVAKKLKIHGRFGIPYEEAHKEIEELMELKASGKMIVMDDKAKKKP